MSQNTTQPYNLPSLQPQSQNTQSQPTQSQPTQPYNLPPPKIKVTTTPPHPVKTRPNPSVVTSEYGGGFYSKNTKVKKSRRRKSKRFQSRRRNRGRK